MTINKRKITISLSHPTLERMNSGAKFLGMKRSTYIEMMLRKRRKF